MEGEQLEAAVVDFDVQGVDRLIPNEDTFDQRRIARWSRL
jgi:hypothetical protein